MSKPEKTIQIGPEDAAQFKEFLDAVHTMLLVHERRLGVIEKVLIEAAKPDRPNQDLTRRRT